MPVIQHTHCLRRCFELLHRQRGYHSEIFMDLAVLGLEDALDRVGPGLEHGGKRLSLGAGAESLHLAHRLAGFVQDDLT